jgi:hypothetical protein
MNRDIEFNSRGVICRGELHLPDGDGPHPLVVMAGGWCYVKEIVMPHYARFFRDKGIGTLLFDYRCMGASGGEPRQHIDPWAQVEDYRNALSFAATLGEVDAARTGVWGISYSGGHVLIVAAIDARAKFAISTIPVVKGWPTVRRCHGERRFADMARLVAEDRERRFRGEPSGPMAFSALDPETEDSVWPFPTIHQVFHRIKAAEAPLHEHWNTIESLELLMNYDVEPFCKRIVDTPVLMTVAEGDNITSHDLEIETFNAITNPNKTLAVIQGVNHMSLYSDADHLTKVGTVQSAWLHRLVSGAEAGRYEAAAE